MNKGIIVSVVMPIYNESKYIDKCVQSLLNQDYTLELMEWIFVDGKSSDDTVKGLEREQLYYWWEMIIRLFKKEIGRREKVQ